MRRTDDEVPGGTADLCSRCTHYRVTWDRNAPHGCRAMDFKSRRRPCRVVIECSGTTCRMFREKQRTVP